MGYSKVLNKTKHFKNSPEIHPEGHWDGLKYETERGVAIEILNV